MHFNVASEVITTTKLILNQRLSAAKTITHQARLQRKWGARDRRLHAEQCYQLIRNLRYLVFLSTGQCEDLVTTQISSEDLWNAWSAMILLDSKSLPEFDTLIYVNEDDIKSRLNLEVSADIKESVQSWMYQLLVNDYGSEAPTIAHVLNQPAAVFVRVNSAKALPAEVISMLQETNIPYRVVGNDSFEILDRTNLAQSNLIQNGFVEIQDLSSQQIAPFINPQAGQRVIDACAGAGGKTLHLANLMGGKGQIVALDNHSRRLEQLKKRAKRNGVHNIEVRLIESSKTTKRLAQSADHVLLDVPCSGSGVWRRKPESKWSVTKADFDSLINTQQQLLSDYQRMVKPGGYLTYATCSVFDIENRQQINQFLSQNDQQWQLEEELVITPSKGSGDGFYAAKLKNLN